MFTDTLHGTRAPNKSPALDPWLAGWMLAGIQDRKYLDSLPPDQRDKTTKALSDLEQLQQLPEGRVRDMALERLARYVAREWEPKGRIKIALKERAEIEGKPRPVLKHDAIRRYRRAAPEPGQMRIVLLQQAGHHRLIGLGLLQKFRSPL